MKELDELNKLALPTIDFVSLDIEDLDPELDEEADEDMSANDIAEAQANAASAGKEIGKVEVASMLEAGRTKAKAVGKFKLIDRGKNANKPAGSETKEKPEQ